MPPSAKKRGWLDPIGEPYVLVLRNAVFYPHHCLRHEILRWPWADGAPPPLPAGLSFKELGLVTSADHAIFPDSLGKSAHVPPVVMPGPDTWQAKLPEVVEKISGTWLFAEMFYGHFGHGLIDMPARLWPFETGLVDARRIDGIIGQGILGSGPTGKGFPAFAKTLLAAIGVGPDQVRFADGPVQIERLLIPRRIAPYMALWHPIIPQMMRRAGAAIAEKAHDDDLPKRVWLSRARLRHNKRFDPSLALLDDLAERCGLSVVHPQELAFPTQVKLARNATHIAGPVGSQLHLCAFNGQHGTKVLTVAPDHFKLDINQKYLSDMGGKETHFLVPADKPRGPRENQPWAFAPTLSDDLCHTMRNWLQDH